MGQNSPHPVWSKGKNLSKDNRARTGSSAPAGPARSQKPALWRRQPDLLRLAAQQASRISSGDSTREAAGRALILSGTGRSYVKSYETCGAGPGAKSVAAKALIPTQRPSEKGWAKDAAGQALCPPCAAGHQGPRGLLMRRCELSYTAGVHMNDVLYSELELTSSYSCI